jgi:hypothetical protein
MLGSARIKASGTWLSISRHFSLYGSSSFKAAIKT